MLSPRRKSMNILGLGYSVGTNGKVLTADVVVVQSFDELRQRADELKGKFVVFDFEFENYGKNIEYRVFGPTIAAKFGAVGALVTNKLVKLIQLSCKL